MRNKIRISFTDSNLQNAVLRLNIRKYIATALRMQKVDFPVEINVLVTDDLTIRAINKAGRGIDKATDVLSFPMFTLTPGILPEDPAELSDPETGLVPLGDMTISLDHAKAQALEYGHSQKREVGYLVVHSVLHLLGYDHLDEGPMKAQMREREEIILKELHLKRG